MSKHPLSVILYLESGETYHGTIVEIHSNYCIDIQYKNSLGEVCIAKKVCNTISPETKDFWSWDLGQTIESEKQS